MATVTSIRIPRRQSTPLAIDLVPTHLPPDVRTALEHLQQTRADLAQDEAAGDDTTAAQEAAQLALEDFAATGAASSTAIRGTATAAFVSAVEQASAAIYAAMDHLVEAQQAASLALSVCDGKPVLHTDTKTAAEHRTRFILASTRSTLRDVLSELPDGLD